MRRLLLLAVVSGLSVFSSPAAVNLSTIPLNGGNYDIPAGTLISNLTLNPGTSVSERDIRQNRDNAMSFTVNSNDWPNGIIVDRIYILYEQGIDIVNDFNVYFGSVADANAATLNFVSNFESEFNLTFPAGSPIEGTAILDVDDRYLSPGAYAFQFDTDSSDPKIIKWSLTGGGNQYPDGRVYQGGNSENNDYAFGIIGVPAGIDLAITKSSDPVLLFGTNLTYTLQVTNTLQFDAFGVVVTDSLPANVAFVSSTPPPSSQMGQTLVYDLGALPAGAATSIVIDVTSTTSGPIMLTNHAVVATTNQEFILNNNQAMALTRVPDPGLPFIVNAGVSNIADVTAFVNGTLLSTGTASTAVS
ncbi:MAG: hypothetical protein AAF492_01605, partial [Verrucomicrobiota bacterium]